MERIRAWWNRTPQREYERIDGEEGEAVAFETDEGLQGSEVLSDPFFSWLEYSIFLWMGVSMLWAWYVTFPPEIGVECASN